MATMKYSLTIDAPIAVADYGSVTYTVAVGGTLQYATATTDQVLGKGPIGSAKIDAFYLKSDQALTVEFDASTGGTAITLDANKAMFMAGTAVTNIYITNASGSTATIEYFMVGAL